ncbi:Ig-like domain-containing protein [Leucobacter luti]|uniref:Invasin-like protein n=1 Tax=Leucobacter luti TaxID=340320 RepID=A0A4Q7U1E2_9MICO|nr:Ig-like domain-containing protein [Leucobacter luti]MBL3698795.1 hypothetical protein [Leucobacter luti]RZT66172.1 invasin-like protein [Leucobacter luti]
MSKNSLSRFASGVRIVGSIATGALVAGGLAAVAVPAHAQEQALFTSTYADAPKAGMSPSGAAGTAVYAKTYWTNTSGENYNGAFTIAAEAVPGAQYHESSSVTASSYFSNVWTPQTAGVQLLKDYCTVSAAASHIECTFTATNWGPGHIMEVMLPMFLPVGAPLDTFQNAAATLTVDGAAYPGLIWTRATSVTDIQNAVTAGQDGSDLAGTAPSGTVVSIADSRGVKVGSARAAGKLGAWSIPHPGYSDILTPTYTAVDGAVSTGEPFMYWATQLSYLTPAEGTAISDTDAFTGTGEPGSTVALSDDTGVELGAAYTNPGGQWTVVPDAAAPAGARTFTAREITDRGHTRSATLDATVLGNVSPEESTLAAHAAQLVVDAEGGFQIIVTTRDSDGNALYRPDTTIELDTSFGTLTDMTDRGDGTYAFALSSERVGGSTVSVRINGVEGAEMLHLAFVAGDATLENSTLTVDRDAIRADGITASTVTVQLRDRFDNPRTSGGESVRIHSSLGTVSATTDHGDGSYSATVSGTTPGAATVVFTLGGAPAAAQATIELRELVVLAPPTGILSSATVATGKGTPGATIVITYQNLDDQVVGTAVVGADGDWRIEYASPQPTGFLATYATDGSGDRSDIQPFRVDATPPTAPILHPSNGTSVSGSGEPGAALSLRDAAGTEITRIVIPADGAFTIVLDPAVVHGTVLHATVTDRVGNEGPGTAVRVDGEAPNAPVVAPSAGAVVVGTGEPGTAVTVTNALGETVATGSVDSEGRFSVELTAPALDGDELRVVLTDVAGNASDVTVVVVDAVAPDAPDAAPTSGATVTGTAEPGATVVIADPDGTVRATGVANERGEFSIEIAPSAEHGAELAVSARDAAGNTSAPVTIVVDAAAPNAPAVAPTQGTIVTGHGEPGATVVVRDTAGTLIGTGTVADQGTFSVTLDPAAPHGTELLVELRDAAGNTSEVSPLTVDSESPDTPVVDGLVDAVLRGTGEPGATVAVRGEDGTVLGEVMVGSDGAFVIELSVAPAPGAILTITATDPSGNVSADLTHVVPEEIVPEETEETAPEETEETEETEGTEGTEETAPEGTEETEADDTAPGDAGETVPGDAGSVEGPGGDSSGNAGSGAAAGLGGAPTGGGPVAGTVAEHGEGLATTGAARGGLALGAAAALMALGGLVLLALRRRAA